MGDSSGTAVKACPHCGEFGQGKFCSECGAGLTGSESLVQKSLKAVLAIPEWMNDVVLGLYYALFRPVKYSESWSSGKGLGNLSPLGLLISANSIVAIFKVLRRFILTNNPWLASDNDFGPLRIFVDSNLIESARQNRFQYEITELSIIISTYWILGFVFGLTSWALSGTKETSWKLHFNIGCISATVLIIGKVVVGIISRLFMFEISNAVFLIPVMIHTMLLCVPTRKGHIAIRYTFSFVQYLAIHFVLIVYASAVSMLALLDLPFF